MEISQVLIFVVIFIQVILVVTTLYYYMKNRLRLFFYMGLGFLALLVVSLIQAVLGGADTSAYVSLLEAGAGLFFIAGVLSAV